MDWTRLEILNGLASSLNGRERREGGEWLQAVDLVC